MPTAPVAQGWLIKRDRFGGGLKERWFSMLDGQVRYYKGVAGERAVGAFALVRAHVKALGQSQLVVSVPGRTYQLHAPDEGSRNQWLCALREGIDEARQPGRRALAKRTALAQLPSWCERSPKAKP